MKSNNVEDGLLYLSILFMFLLPLLPTNIKPYVIGFFGLSVLWNAVKEGFNFNKTYFLANASVYLLILVSLLYTENLEYGSEKLETMVSLLVFPFIFSVFPKSKFQLITQHKYTYMFIFVMAILLFNIISFLYHVGHYKETLFIHYPTVNRIAQGPYSIHPIYLSMHICVALLFSFFLLKKQRKIFKTMLLIMVDILLFAFLLMLMKKGPILVLGIVFILFALFQGNRKFIHISLGVLAMSALIISSIPEYRSKFSELVKIENVEEGGITSTNLRYSIYKSAVKTILEAPIFGYGIGDANDKLMETYKEDSMVLFKNKYNSHNQYSSFFLSIGLIGLLAFLVMLTYNLVFAIRFDNQILILLLIFYGLMMSFENILEREDGVIFFSFFTGFFHLFSNKDENR